LLAVKQRRKCGRPIKQVSPPPTLAARGTVSSLAAAHPAAPVNPQARATAPPAASSMQTANASAESHRCHRQRSPFGHHYSDTIPIAIAAPFFVDESHRRPADL